MRRSEVAIAASIRLHLQPSYVRECSLYQLSDCIKLRSGHQPLATIRAMIYLYTHFTSLLSLELVLSLLDLYTFSFRCAGQVSRVEQRSGVPGQLSFG
mgnify:CR=1 FL=1